MAFAAISFLAGSATASDALFRVGGGRFHLGSQAQSLTVARGSETSGTLWIAALADGRTVVRSLDDARVDETLRSPEGGVGLAAASVRGDVLAWTGTRSVNWRVEDGKPQRLLISAPRALAVSLDGSWIGVAAQGEHLTVIESATAAVYELAMTGGAGAIAATGSGFWVGGPSGLYEWRASDTELRRIALPGDGPVSVVAGGKTRVAWRGTAAIVWVGERSTPLSLPDFGSVAVAESGLTIAVRSPRAISIRSALRAAAETLALPDLPHGAVAFTPDGGLLAVATADALVRFYDTRTGQDRTPGGPTLHATAIAWEWGDLWVGDRGGAIARVGPKGELTQLATAVHKGQVTFVGRDGKQLLTGGLDTVLLAHEPKELDGAVTPKALLERRYGGFQTAVKSIYLAAQGERTLAIARGGGTVQVLERATDAVHDVRVERAPLALAVGPGLRLALAGPGDALLLYDLEQTPIPRTVSLEGAAAVALQGDTVLVGARDGLHRFGWTASLDLETALTSPVRAVAFSGEDAIAGLSDGRVVIVDAAGALRATYGVPSPKTDAGAILELAVDRATGRVAARDAAGTVMVYQLP